MKLPWKTKKQKLEEEKERLKEEKKSKVINFITKVRNFIAYFFIVMGLLMFTDEPSGGIFFIGFGISLLPKLYEYLKKYEKFNNKKTAVILPIVTFFVLLSLTATDTSVNTNTIDTSNQNVAKVENVVENEITNTTANVTNEVSNEVIDNTATNTVSNTVENNVVDEKVVIANLNKQKDDAVLKVPAYSKKAYVEINNNKPFFADFELKEESYESYSDLDSLGRCGAAVACVGKDIMPTEERGTIGSVKPTGWHTVKYQGIDGNYLYNRCHLIGYQLSGENANTKNLITGTRYMNNEGMLPFENMVADYIKENDNHVLYRVTPIFEGDNLLASGVLIEAKSVEDNGDGIEFCLYCYNVQPGITINYANGESDGPEFKGSETNKTSTTTVPATTTTQTTKKEQTSTSTPSTSTQTTTKPATTIKPSTTSKPAATQPAPAAPAPAPAPTVNSEMVWIPRTGKKFHNNPGCSNMSNPSQVTRSQAEASGFTACKKCY